MPNTQAPIVINTGEQNNAELYLKYASIAIAAGASSFVVYKIYKAIIDKRIENKELQKYKDAIDKKELLHTEAWYKKIAEKLYNAMIQFDIDESVIYEKLRLLNNNSEWNNIILQFGKRKTGHEWTFNLVDGDLVFWLKKLLDDDFYNDEIGKVRETLVSRIK